MKTRVRGQIQTGSERKIGVYRTNIEPVIANQRARWCGNPPDFQDTIIEQLPFLPTFMEELGLFWLAGRSGGLASVRTGSQ